MSLIQNLSSILKTWVFKKKVLQFSKRYRRETQSCFYCPEMCRFSCPVAETLRTNAVTPRGKMSILHLMERGAQASEISDSTQNTKWYLEQCTGCGRCTEFCLHEIDVGSHLRDQREKLSTLVYKVSDVQKQVFKKRVLLIEKARAEWWKSKGLEIVKQLEVDAVLVDEFNSVAWEAGELHLDTIKEYAKALAPTHLVITESAETAWFLEKALKEKKQIRTEIRTLWQLLFPLFGSRDFSPSEIFHESFYLSRLLPRQGYSIPMYEKNFLPFHQAWNVYDCGGEGYYKTKHELTAAAMRDRFFQDVKKDGRTVSRIIVQNFSCKSHLDHLENIEVSYWLDEIV